MEERTPQIGDLVLYVLPDGKSAGQSRPAFVVQAWSGGYYNLQVFVDGTNDYPDYTGAVWATSVRFSPIAEPRTFHYAEP